VAVLLFGFDPSGLCATTREPFQASLLDRSPLTGRLNRDFGAPIHGDGNILQFEQGRRATGRLIPSGLDLNCPLRCRTLARAQGCVIVPGTSAAREHPGVGVGGFDGGPTGPFFQVRHERAVRRRHVVPGAPAPPDQCNHCREADHSGCSIGLGGVEELLSTGV